MHKIERIYAIYRTLRYGQRIEERLCENVKIGCCADFEIDERETWTRRSVVERRRLVPLSSSCVLHSRLEFHKVGRKNPRTKGETNSYKTGRGRKTKYFSGETYNRVAAWRGNVVRFKARCHYLEKKGLPERETGRTESGVRDNICDTPDRPMGRGGRTYIRLRDGAKGGLKSE